MARKKYDKIFEARIKSGEPFTAIGMMSGTSMDGIDVALIRTDGLDFVEALHASEYPYDAAFKKQIEAGLAEAAHLETTSQRTPFLNDLEFDLTQRHIAAIANFIKSFKLNAHDIDVIGFHGQTVLHRPGKHYTVQLGLGQMLANQTGIAVVYDMRANDMVHGGQGAPLVPVFHQALAASLGDKYSDKMPVAFVNIGGISNISYVGTSDELIAFDTGPGNALIDQWVHANAGIPYDQGGLIAAEGRIIQTIAQQYLAESFFKQSVPKSLDRNDFKALDAQCASLEDGARTLAYVSAAAILKSCDHLPEPPKLWIICGGGRKNPKIMDDLKVLAKEKNSADVILAEEASLDGDSMEAQAWAYLAVRSIKNLPLTFPKTTGCREPVSGGKLIFPKQEKES